MYYQKYQNRSPLVLSCPQSINTERGRQLLHVLAEKDMYTYVHSQYVAEYAVDLARAMQLPEHVVEEIRIAGWLHDVGKILISTDILRKPVRLNSEEYNTVKRHVIDGLNILQDLNLSPVCKNAILHHHERWDGRGYPFGRTGQETPIEGRILQIADAFSAMSIKRVYRERASLAETVEELRQCSGVQFDPVLVHIFIDLILKKKQAS